MKEEHKAYLLDSILACIYNLTILGATYYIVFVLGHSGWWFLLAVAICSRPHNFKED